MPLTHYSKFSMLTLRIWVFKPGVLKKIFILSKHGTKANIRSTKMANNRHAYNMDVLQSYWTSDGLPLCCSQPTGEETHTNQMSVCQQWTFNDSLWLKSRWFQTVSNCSCWQTSIGQPVLFEYGTGDEWHPSNQTLQCHVFTIRCYPSSAGSCEVFHIVGLCVFPHQSADYSIVVAHLTSNSFEGHPCCMHADYLPFLCFW
jgi:hypothetical protein